VLYAPVSPARTAELTDAVLGQTLVGLRNYALDP